MDRAEGTRFLLQEGRSLYDFVIRNSSRGHGGYALTVRVDDSDLSGPGSFYNGLIELTPQGYRFKNTCVAAPSLDELVALCVTDRRATDELGLPACIRLPDQQQAPACPQPRTGVGLLSESPLLDRAVNIVKDDSSDRLPSARHHSLSMLSNAKEAVAVTPFPRSGSQGSRLTDQPSSPDDELSAAVVSDLDNNCFSTGIKAEQLPLAVVAENALYVEALSDTQLKSLGITYDEDGLNPAFGSAAAGPLVNRKSKPDTREPARPPVSNLHEDTYVCPDPVVLSELKHGRAGPVHIQRSAVRNILQSTRHQWLRSDLSQEQAEVILKTLPLGSFLVRAGSQQVVEYVFSAHCPPSAANISSGNWCWHASIGENTSGIHRGFQLLNTAVIAYDLVSLVARLVCDKALSQKAGVPCTLVLPGDNIAVVRRRRVAIRQRLMRSGLSTDEDDPVDPLAAELEPQSDFMDEEVGPQSGREGPRCVVDSTNNDCTNPFLCMLAEQHCPLPTEEDRGAATTDAKITSGSEFMGLAISDQPMYDMAASRTDQPAYDMHMVASDQPHMDDMAATAVMTGFSGKQTAADSLIDNCSAGAAVTENSDSLFDLCEPHVQGSDPDPNPNPNPVTAAADHLQGPVE